MALVASRQCPLLVFSHVRVATGKHLFWRKACQSTVVVLEVVPLEVILTPRRGMDHALEAARVVRLILLCLELAFAERVVIADARSAVAAGDIQLLHILKVAVGDHW